MTAPPSSTENCQVLLPGATLGVLGSGQLGRMFAMAAARLGYQVHVFSPHAESPAGDVAAFQTVAEYDDLEAVAKFAQSVDVVTLEFENVPTAATDAAAKHAPVHPSSHVLHITQDRLREKRFLGKIDVPCTPFAEVTTAEQLALAVEQIGLPAVLKTTAWGYDGKGQVKLTPDSDAMQAWESFGRQPMIYEGWVEYQQELSVIVARSTNGETACYPAIANDHVNHILDTSHCPAPELGDAAQEAQQMAERIATELGAIGVLGVEFFLTTDGRLLVNEIAPRTHNTGHLTLDACVTSQFEQQVRAICGLPLGSTEPHHAAAMANLLGDLWQQGAPPWNEILTEPNLHLHLYGKSEAKKGRKMGHLTVLADTAEQALLLARSARNRLS